MLLTRANLKLKRSHNRSTIIYAKHEFPQGFDETITAADASRNASISGPPPNNNVTTLYCPENDWTRLRLRIGAPLLDASWLTTKIVSRSTLKSYSQILVLYFGDNLMISVLKLSLTFLRVAYLLITIKIIFLHNLNNFLMIANFKACMQICVCMTTLPPMECNYIAAIGRLNTGTLENAQFMAVF